MAPGGDLDRDGFYSKLGVKGECGGVLSAGAEYTRGPDGCPSFKISACVSVLCVNNEDIFATDTGIDRMGDLKPLELEILKGKPSIKLEGELVIGCCARLIW